MRKRSDAALALAGLALIPCFSYALAFEVVGATFAADRRRGGNRQVAAAIEALASVGGIEPARALLKVPDLARESVRAAGYPLERSVIRDISNLFVSHAEGSMEQSLEAYLGPRGAALTTLCYAVSAQIDAAAAGAASELAHYLYSSRDYGRLGDLGNARGLLATILPHDHRVLTFIDALTAWNQGQRDHAAALFTDSLGSDVGADAIGGMASQLVGVFAASRGRWDVAIEFASNSVTNFESRGDDRGNMKSRETLARIRSEKGIATGDFELIAGSLRGFDESMGLARAVEQRFPLEARNVVGRAQIGASRSYAALGLSDEARIVAELATRQFEPQTDQSLEALRNLSSILREAGHAIDAFEAMSPLLLRRLSDAQPSLAILAGVLEAARVYQSLGESEALRQTVEHGVRFAEALGDSDTRTELLSMVKGNATSSGAPRPSEGEWSSLDPDAQIRRLAARLTVESHANESEISSAIEAKRSEIEVLPVKSIVAQIRLLSEQVNDYRVAIERNHRDFSSRRAHELVVGERRRLLAALWENSPETHARLISELIAPARVSPL